MKKSLAKGLLGTALLLAAAPTIADPQPAAEKQELLELKNTVVNLVDALVKQGVLQPEMAAALVKKAETDAAAQAAQQVAAAPAAAAEGAQAEAAAAPTNSKVVRVGYVPEFVKKEIREQVRAELREDVLTDVSQKAKQERWGTPDALPAWINSIKISGDARVRNEYNKYGQDNADTLSTQNLYLDIPRVNAAGGISQAGARAFLNTSDDNNRWRERVRLNLRAAVSDHWTFDTRVATGNQSTPVSTNQTLGNTGQRFSITLDRAALLYELPAEQGMAWLNSTVSFSAGRIANPWVSTDLVWDEDLNFDGAALSLRRPIGQEDGLGGLGPTGRALFATIGLFPLQQVEFSSQDKWLAGGQAGAAWEFENQNKLQLAGAYYRYIHITGKKNTLGSTLRNSTQPTFLQKGNLLYDISNDPNLDRSTNELFALAADYHLLDINLSLDLATFAPYHVIFKGDVVKNLGYDRDEVTRRAGGAKIYLYSTSERTLGWLFEVVGGWPQVVKFRDWQVSASYRYLQRDAVLDAFTDSDFHLGGTDAKGWVVGGKYGIARNTWLQLRYLSSEAIDGPKLGIDTLQVDLNAKFSAVRHAACALLMLAAAGSHAEGPNAQAALSRAQGMLRQLNDAKQQLELDNAKLKASNAALEQQLKIGRLNLAAREADIVSRGKEASDAKAGIARLETRNAQLTARLEEVVAKYKEAAGNAKELGANKAQLESDLKTARAALADAEEKNRAMFEVSRGILERYKKKSHWTALLQKEPFTGIKQVEVESSAESDEHALEDQLLEKNLDAAQ